MFQILAKNQIRNRVKEVKTMRLGDLARHPHNPKTHTEKQANILNGLLKNIGWAGSALPLADEQTIPGAIKREQVIRLSPCRNVLFCGGEPLLQLDEELIGVFKSDGWYTVIETNGAVNVPDGIDWVTCSPKVAEHALKVTHANELKYVRAMGQGIPKPQVVADFYSISPMFSGNDVDKETLQWCLKLVMDNPQWALTIQHHKTSFGGVR